MTGDEDNANMYNRKKIWRFMSCHHFTYECSWVSGGFDLSDNTFPHVRKVNIHQCLLFECYGEVRHKFFFLKELLYRYVDTWHTPPKK